MSGKEAELAALFLLMHHDRKDRIRTSASLLPGNSRTILKPTTETPFQSAGVIEFAGTIQSGNVLTTDMRT
jgi:hypothetical protein